MPIGGAGPAALPDDDSWHAQIDRHVVVCLAMISPLTATLAGSPGGDTAAARGSTTEDAAATDAAQSTGGGRRS